MARVVLFWNTVFACGAISSSLWYFSRSPSPVERANSAPLATIRSRAIRAAATPASSERDWWWWSAPAALMLTGATPRSNLPSSRRFWLRASFLFPRARRQLPTIHRCPPRCRDRSPCGLPFRRIHRPSRIRFPNRMGSGSLPPVPSPCPGIFAACANRSRAMMNHHPPQFRFRPRHSARGRLPLLQRSSLRRAPCRE